MEKAQSYTIASSSNTSVALNLVTQRCPGVENITMYLGPPDDSFAFAPAQTTALHVLLGAPMSHTWLNARNLQSLVTDVFALDASSFLALGELPYLGSLEIRKLSGRYHNDSEERLPNTVQTMTLSNNSFPSLRHLAIHEIHKDDISLLWNHKPLVEKLNRVELTILSLAPGRMFKDELVQNEPFLTPFLPALCVGSPQITELVIDNPEGTPEMGVLRLDMEHIKCFASLPLQRIKLVGIHIVCVAPDGAAQSFAEHAANLWPMVVDLNLFNQKVYPTALHHFSSIPSLRCLVVSLHDSWPYDKPNPPTTDNHALRTLEFNQGSGEDLDSVPTDNFAR